MNNSTTVFKRSKMRQTDPRYTRGVYTNTAGQHRQEASNRLNWQVVNNPLNWGWQFMGWYKEYQPMYHQAGLQLTRIGDCWHVAKLGEKEGRLYGGSAKLVTGYLWALGYAVL